MPTAKYFPSLTIRQSECEALSRLAEPTKDSIFPIVRLQAWPHPKQGEGGPVERSTDHLSAAFGVRKIGMDLALPSFDPDKVYKMQARADWAARGRIEIAALNDPTGAFRAWCDFIECDDRRVPVVQWTDNQSLLRAQVDRLASLGRGIILRFRRSRGWNLEQAAALAALPLGDVPLLMVYDYEQIKAGDDLTSIGVMIQRAILASNSLIVGGKRDYVFKASSFPSEFASIGEEYACLPIRERLLFDMLKSSPPIVAAGIQLSYGDHAAVYASDREPAFRGVPRVDYPTPGEWFYHRRREGFQKAAEYVRADARWDDTNLCWGAHRIREAATGQMEGLNAAGRWTTIRMNIHMHVQAHSVGVALTTDEPWTD